MKKDKQLPVKPPLQTVIQLKSAGAVVVTPKSMPLPDGADREIHARRTLPIVPDAVDPESDKNKSTKV